MAVISMQELDTIVKVLEKELSTVALSVYRSDGNSSIRIKEKDKIADLIEITFINDDTFKITIPGLTHNLIVDAVKNNSKFTYKE